MADPQFYESSFGGQRLWLSRISTDLSRTVVVHELSHGDEHPVQDQGRGPVRVTASARFDWFLDDVAPIDQIRALKALIDDKPRILSHPVEGSFLARVGPFTYDVGEDSVITAELQFFAVQEVVAVSPAGAGGIPASAEGAVAAAATSLTAELDELGVASTLPTEAAAAADSWSADPELNPRAVYAQTGSLTERISILADDLEADHDTWPAYRATILLAEALRAAAESATAALAQTFQLQVGAPIALRALVASIYGADEADDRYLQAMRLNDLANPACIDAGTMLQMPVVRGAARNA